MKKLSKIFLGLIASAMIFTGCTDSGTAPDNNADTPAEKLIVGTNPEFPPFEYVESDGSIGGFDFALMNEIGNRIGREVEFKSMEFKSLIGAMEAGTIDAAIAGMTVTDERKQSVDFSDTYYQANQYIVVKKDSTVKSLSDLNGKKIAVQEGTTGDFIASGDGDLVKDAEVKRFKKGVDAIMDLKNGSVDAVVIDSNPAQEFVKANSDELMCIEDKSSEEFYAIALKKGDTELLEAVNKALKEIKEDGTFDKLIAEYITQANLDNLEQSEETSVLSEV